MQYYYSNDGTNQQGPADLEGLKNAGITRQTLVWREGMSAWTPAGEIAELADLFTTEIVELEYTPAPAPVVPQQPTEPLSYQGQYQQQNQSPNGLAVASLVLGIIGIVGNFCYCVGTIPGILAIVFGHISRGQIRKGNGSGEGMALAGLILGYITAAMALLAVVFFLVMMVFGIATSAATTTFTPAPAPTVVPAPRTIPSPPRIPTSPTFPTH